ncbi:TonB-linked SusC/RagA family outer membrane protein [Dysgonomonas alginatilytica]|uniref:TonB-linked SusC/RagA family outer membrane protein n=1 Tax=Dysgonomonas alginatilytica TaxID=1605892 RepID=A0A2V3PP79_9BACT|nr:SusC/RagA family TonB-linked outer membrane protein [Dysgonomonas alginatilytica]PXV57127.1 TonB-linked SusC/RagA family outer membrane protein [Dysgonomonas alginatilytica]
MLHLQSQSLYNIAKALLLTLFLLGGTVIYAQTTINGEVYDRNRLPLPGVSITLKSSAKVNTATDFDGKFSIKVSEDLPVTLVFNFLGYRTQEVDVYDSNEPISVTLSENNNLLDEVVVTALGISREKKSLGYTTQEIKGNDLNQNGETNLLNSLSGRVAGVRITNSQGDMGSSRIVIRGETSISGENSPLFIVDGIPVDNSQKNSGGATRDFGNTIADINPEDIESMSVLKGPNAAALYGSRAARGVILITTKSGKGQKGLGISVNSGIHFATVATLPSFQNSFGQGMDGLFSYVDGKGGGINDGVDESWGPAMNGQLIPQFFSNGKAVPFVANPDNVRDFFRTGVTYDNSISIAGSDTKYDFRLGVNNQKQKGIVPNTELSRTNFTINTNYHITKDITVGTTANYIITDAPNLPGGPSGGRAAGVMLQFLWFGRQVDINELKNNRAVNWNNSYYSNPYWNAYYNTVSQKRNRLIGDVHLEAKIIEGLTFNFRSGTDYYNDRRKYKIKYGTNGTPFGSYAEDAYTINETNTEGILRYNTKLSDDFSLDALVGTNVLNRSEENNYQKAPRLAIPDLYTLTNSRDAIVTSNNSIKLRRIYSVYSSAQFGYKNYAYLNLTARNDWSSTLPRNNRSYFYPSVSASLVLSEALDIKNDVLSFLKVRGGWSEVGNDNDPHNLYTVFDGQTPFGDNPIQTSSTKKLNPELKPERTRSTELGFELGLWGNKVSIDASYYNTNSYDQIIAVNTSAASGHLSQLLNAGNLNNKGFEVQLNVLPIETKKFKWNVGLNYSRNISKLTRMDDKGELDSYTIGSSNGVSVLASVGKAYGALFGTAYLRDKDGNIIVNASGLPQSDPTLKVLGHFTPTWIGGISNSFTYKNIQLSFLIDASIGGSIYSGTNRTGMYTGVLEQTMPGRNADNGGLYYYFQNNDKEGSKILLDARRAPNGETVYQDGMIFNGVTADGQKNTTVISAQQYYKASYNISEAYLYDADYIKFREITLSYSFDKTLTKRLGLQGATVSFVGRNLFFIYKDAPNIDPETAFNTGNAQGLESLSLPTTRTIGFNLNLKF